MAKVNGVIPERVVYAATSFANEDVPTWNGKKITYERMLISSPVSVLDVKSKSINSMIERHSGVSYGAKCFFPLTSVFYVDNDPVKVRITEKNRYDEKSVSGIVKINDLNVKVTMSNSCLVETLTSVGVSEGGELNGEFVWMRSGSDTRLTRVNSDEYFRYASETTTRNSLSSAINRNELIPGAFYRTATSTVLYCGAVEHDNYHVELKPTSTGHSWQFTYKTLDIKDVTYSKTVMKHAWIDLDEEEFNRSKSGRYIHVCESASRRVFKKQDCEVVDLDALFASVRALNLIDIEYADRNGKYGAGMQAYEGDFNGYSISRLANTSGYRSSIRRAGADVDFPNIVKEFNAAVKK